MVFNLLGDWKSGLLRVGVCLAFPARAFSWHFFRCCKMTHVGVRLRTDKMEPKGIIFRGVSSRKGLFHMGEVAGVIKLGFAGHPKGQARNQLTSVFGYKHTSTSP